MRGGCRGGEGAGGASASYTQGRAGGGRLREPGAVIPRAAGERGGKGLPDTGSAEGRTPHPGSLRRQR